MGRAVSAEKTGGSVGFQVGVDVGLSDSGATTRSGLGREEGGGVGALDGSALGLADGRALGASVAARQALNARSKSDPVLHSRHATDPGAS